MTLYIRYRARKTLLIKFENDALDESEEVEKVLREANTIMRMKRPMIEMEVELKVMQGTHVTPLTQNVLLDPPADAPGLIAQLDVLKTVRQDARKNFLQTVDEVSGAIITFLSDSVGAPPIAADPVQI